MIIALSGFMGCGKSSVARKLAGILSCPAIDLDKVIEEEAGHSVADIFACEGEEAFRTMELSALRTVLAKYGESEEGEELSARNFNSGSAPSSTSRDDSRPEPSVDDPAGENNLAGSESAEAGPDAGAGNTDDAGDANVDDTDVDNWDEPAEEVKLVLALGGGTLTTPRCAALVREQTTCFYLRGGTEFLASRLDHDNGKRPMLYNGVPVRERIEQLMKERGATYESVAHYIVDIDGKSPFSVARDIALILKKY